MWCYFGMLPAPSQEFKLKEVSLFTPGYILRTKSDVKDVVGT